MLNRGCNNVNSRQLFTLTNDPVYSKAHKKTCEQSDQRFCFPLKKEETYPYKGRKEDADKTAWMHRFRKYFESPKPQEGMMCHLNSQIDLSPESTKSVFDITKIAVIVLPIQLYWCGEEVQCRTGQRDRGRVNGRVKYQPCLS